MRGRYKRKDPKEIRDETADIGAGLSAPPAPPPGEPAAGLAEPNTPVPALTVQDVGSRKKGREACCCNTLPSSLAVLAFVLARVIFVNFSFLTNVTH